MKQEIIYIAIENLKQTAGIEASWKAKGPQDGVFDFTVNNHKYTFVVEVKREIRAHQLQQFIDLNNHHECFLLVANRIFPKIKEELRQRGLSYLEANGNVFIKTEGFFVFIDTQKPLNIEKSRGNRAFTKTGLKVLFYLLQHKDAINLTQRELAEKTGVGLGNIPQVIDGLKETGFLIPLNNRAFLWENRKGLLDRWVAEYATVLRPKLKKERFALNGQWQNLKFDSKKTLWGGEPAADILTNYLRPEKFLIYTIENRMELIKKYKIVPDSNGDIEVLEMFWKPQNEQTVPPLLVYADLITTGGKRNIETAEKIYHEFIQPNL